MRAIDICAGAGGMTEGLARAGWTVEAIERDKDAVDTHRRHAGPCELADVQTWHPRRSAALVAGGVPCQPYSAAGRGGGDEDERALWPEFLRIAREANAQAVLLENVPGLMTRHAKVFRTILDAFEREYHTTWRILDAADYGVPQFRDRIFVVGFRDEQARARWRWPMPTHSPPGSLFGLPYVTVRQALGLGPGDFRKGPKAGSKPNKRQGMRYLDVDAPAYTIVGGTSQELLDRPSATILTSAGRQTRQKSRPGARPLGELAAQLTEAGLLDRPATVVAAGASGRVPRAGHHNRQHNGAVRLSPEHCAILQGFPSDWTFTGSKESQYRQIGNAVPPVMGQALGSSIRASLG